MGLYLVKTSVGVENDSKDHQAGKGSEEIEKKMKRHSQGQDAHCLATRGRRSHIAGEDIGCLDDYQRSCDSNW